MEGNNTHRSHITGERRDEGGNEVSLVKVRLRVLLEIGNDAAPSILRLGEGQQAILEGERDADPSKAAEMLEDQRQVFFFFFVNRTLQRMGNY